MAIPLFTSHFFRESYCLYLLWNSSCSKLRLGCKKKIHGFVAYSVTQNETIPPKKWKIVYFNSGALARLLWRTCHLMGAELSNRLFGQNKPFVFCFFYMCVFHTYMFVSFVAVSVWFCICVADNQCVLTLTEWQLSEWMLISHYGLYGPYLYDYHLYYPAHQCVITDYYHQLVWMSGNISVCLNTYSFEFSLVFSLIFKDIFLFKAYEINLKCLYICLTELNNKNSSSALLG